MTVIRQNMPFISFCGIIWLERVDDYVKFVGDKGRLERGTDECTSKWFWLHTNMYLNCKEYSALITYKKACCN